MVKLRICQLLVTYIALWFSKIPGLNFIALGCAKIHWTYSCSSLPWLFDLVSTARSPVWPQLLVSCVACRFQLTLQNACWDDAATTFCSEQSIKWRQTLQHQTLVPIPEIRTKYNSSVGESACRRHTVVWFWLQTMIGKVSGSAVMLTTNRLNE